MRAIDAFDIVPETSGPDGSLLFGGRSVARLPARCVEAQFRLDEGGYLVFATQDCPFEEELTILYLDAALRERDRLSIGRPYAPGILEAVTPAGPSRVTFRFARAAPWSLDIAPRHRPLGGVSWLHLV